MKPAGIPQGVREPAGEPREYRDRFDAVIAEVLQQALRIAVAEPALLLTGTAILRHQGKAAAIRRNYEKEGVLVPAVMMISLTSRCNLACRGCYQRAQHRAPAPEMDESRLASIVAQAADLGVSVIVFAGGEPLLKKDVILTLAKAHPALLFAVFTNGQLIDTETADAFARLRNIVPVLSFEGFRAETDLRRGAGVYDRLATASSLLRDRRIFSGISVTVTSRNLGAVCSREFITGMLGGGAKAFVFVEYVPIEPGTEDLVLSDGQRTDLNDTIAEFNYDYPALFIGFPGGEEAYGGCLAAGRGFVHVSPSGSLEPCPAAPFSDANLTEVPLAEAFRSGFLAKIRSEHGKLTETNGGCALWTNRDWVQGLLGRP